MSDCSAAAAEATPATVDTGPRSPAVARAVQISLREALEHGQDRVTPTLILLSILRQPGAATQVLEQHAVNDDLSGGNLQGIVLQGTDLTAADLRGTNLRGADLRSALLRGANLRDACLAGARLDNAQFVGAHFTGAGIFGAFAPDDAPIITLGWPSTVAPVASTACR